MHWLTLHLIVEYLSPYELTQCHVPVQAITVRHLLATLPTDMGLVAAVCVFMFLECSRSGEAGTTKGTGKWLLFQVRSPMLGKMVQLRVALSALLTNMRLVLGMNLHVVLQRCTMFESTLANWTRVWPILGVREHVGIHTAKLCECLTALRAAVGTFTSVCPLMLPEGTRAGESHVAHRTGKWFLASMGPHVLSEISAVIEPLVTHSTAVRFIPIMFHDVLLQRPGTCKCLTADLTLVWSLTGMRPHMHSQLSGPGIVFPTLRTGVGLLCRMGYQMFL